MCSERLHDCLIAELTRATGRREIKTINNLIGYV